MPGHTGFLYNCYGNVDSATEAAIGAGGTTRTIDTYDHPFVTFLLSASALTNIVVEWSADGVIFQDGETIAFGAAGEKAEHRTVGARYVRLRSSAAVTFGASVMAKG